MEISGFNIAFFAVLLWNIIFLVFFAWDFIYDIKPKNQKSIIEDLKNKKPLLSKNCGGKIDQIYFTYFAMKVIIYDCGIVLKPALLPNVFIDKSEISYFKQLDSSFNQTEIVNRSKYLKSPLIVNTFIDKEIQDILTQ